MSPIDDELRALLSSRASGVDPAPDPLGGIESRARGLRRRRVVASVSGAAAVVVAVAVAVPLLVSGGGTAVRRQPGTPSTSTSSSATPGSSYALDPQHPWAFRGTALPSGTQAAFQSTWAAAHPGSTITPLWAQVYEPSGQPEELVVATGDGTSRLGFLQGRAGGATIAWDSQVTGDQRSVHVLLGGDEVARLLVVAAPDVDRIDYAPYGTTFTQLAQLAPGVAVGPHEGTSAARYRVLAKDGSSVDEQAVPVTITGRPENVLTTWVHRGDPQRIPDATVVAAFVAAKGAASSTHATYRSLYDGTRGGVRFTIGQAWLDGGTAAHTVAYDSTGAFYLGPITPVDPWVLGAVFSTGSPKDLLVLLPRPGAGRIGYSPDATSPFSDVASGRSDLNSVGLVDRDPRAQADRVQVHRGDDSIILTEGIAKLTCAAKECG